MRPLPSSRVLLLGLVCASVFGTRGSLTLDLPLPGPAPRASLEPVAGIGLPKDASCARCHAEIAAEWKRSLHHRAWENEYFFHAYSTEPLPFCRKCHAPGADPAFEPAQAAREAGVSCATCHVVSAGIVGVRGHAGSPNGHEVLGDARLATEAACGRCHDFAFPGGRVEQAAPGKMQDTLGEHSRSAFAEKTCQVCHMPMVKDAKGGSHHNHDFRVQGDKDMMAKAVVVKNAVMKVDTLFLDLEPGAIGHAFPTGDLYRRVEVRVSAISEKGNPIGDGSTEILGRTFGPTREGPEKVMAAERTDTRLVGPRHFEFVLPKGAKRARYQVVWQKLPPSMAKGFGMKMQENEMVVVEGIVMR